MLKRVEVHLMRREDLGVFGKPQAGEPCVDLRHGSLDVKHTTSLGCFPEAGLACTEASSPSSRRSPEPSRRKPGNAQGLADEVTEEGWTDSQVDAALLGLVRARLMIRVANAETERA